MKTTGHLSLGMAFIILPFVYGCQTMRSEATVKIPTTEKPQDEALSRSVREKFINTSNINLYGVDVVSNQWHSIPDGNSDLAR
jgi:hypothetical protein